MCACVCVCTKRAHALYTRCRSSIWTPVYMCAVYGHPSRTCNNQLIARLVLIAPNSCFRSLNAFGHPLLIYGVRLISPSKCRAYNEGIKLKKRDIITSYVQKNSIKPWTMSGKVRTIWDILENVICASIVWKRFSFFLNIWIEIKLQCHYNLFSWV